MPDFLYAWALEEFNEGNRIKASKIYALIPKYEAREEEILERNLRYMSIIG
jgi:hypothetical protein